MIRLDFQTSPLMGKASTISNSSGVTKVVDKCLHYVGVASLCIFGGNFVLAKVRQALISVCCSELRGVHFSEV